MSSPQPHVVNATSVSEGWSRVLIASENASGHELAPLTLRIVFSANESSEDDRVRNSLDGFLTGAGQDPTTTVANTIFPERRWQMAHGDRKRFFDEYRKVYPRLKAIDTRNKNGTYFGRLIESNEAFPDGQLERLITLYRRHPGLVKMRLQAAVFSPTLDLNGGARPGFPCLQHISLAPYGTELSLNAFYASQQILAKAYGNYSGLAALGRFLAHEMRLEFFALNVFIGMAKLTVPNRETTYGTLLESARRCISESPGGAS